MKNKSTSSLNSNEHKLKLTLIPYIFGTFHLPLAREKSIMSFRPGIAQQQQWQTLRENLWI